MAAVDPRDWMWAEACAMIARAEQLHRRFFQPAVDAVAVGSWEPPIDVFESERELTIVAALPGVEPEDVKVVLEPGQLVVTGVRRLPPMARTILRLEIPHGRFERRLQLPTAKWELSRSTLGNGCLVLGLIRQR